MSVLQSRTATKAAKRSIGFGTYLIVGLLTAAIGVGAVAGIRELTSVDTLSPTRVAAIKADDFADLMENRWIAELNATRNADLVSHYRNGFYAGIAGIEAQRAEDLAEHLEGQYLAEVAEIQEQRAEDMATYRFGGSTR